MGDGYERIQGKNQSNQPPCCVTGDYRTMVFLSKILTAFLLLSSIIYVYVYLQLLPPTPTDELENNEAFKGIIPKNICFHTNQASERGTEIALYDYADYLEQLYGIKSTMLFPNISAIKNGVAFKRFSTRFPIVLYSVEREKIIHTGGKHLLAKAKETHCDFIYIIKSGNKLSNPAYETTFKHSTIPIGIHAVFNYESHGNTYAGISPDVTKGLPYRPVVPHVVRPVNMTAFHARKGLRKSLNISKSAIVICRYGGKDSFDIPFVHQWVGNVLMQQIGSIMTQIDHACHNNIVNNNKNKNINCSALSSSLSSSSLTSSSSLNIAEFVQQLNTHNHTNATQSQPLHRDIHFILMNTNPINIKTPKPTHINHHLVQPLLNSYLHYLPGSSAFHEKEEFIRTCDGMIHARKIGESFGLAIAEFSTHNKPILTYAPIDGSKEHVRILGKKGFPFTSEEELIKKVGPKFLSVLETIHQQQEQAEEIAAEEAKLKAKQLEEEEAARKKKSHRKGKNNNKFLSSSASSLRGESSSSLIGVVEEERDFNAYREYSPEAVMILFVRYFLEPVFGKIQPLVAMNNSNNSNNSSSNSSRI